MISEDIIINVVTNVIYITLVVLTTYAAMFIVKEIINFIIHAFDNIKLFDGIKFKKQNLDRW